MRELTNTELKKLHKFREILDEYIMQESKSLWGRFNIMMADAKNKRELMLDTIELFLTSNIKELEKGFLGSQTKHNGKVEE